MKIFGLGIPELLIILVVILLIFGPKNLPKLGAAIGKGVRSLRNGMNGGNKSDEAANGEVVGDAVVENVENVENVDRLEQTDAAPAAEAAKTVRRVVKKKTATPVE